MDGHDIIVIGASAGGMEGIQRIANDLPADFSASVFVVWHLSPTSRNLLATLLNRTSPVRAASAIDGEAIHPGRIYVAPADRHLVLEADHVRVTHGPKENRFRPAIDPLFRSAAFHFGPRVVGVVLSGNLDDGTAGLWSIKDRGGVAVVQEPGEAVASSMPRNALRHVAVDYCVPLQEIGPLLIRLVNTPTPRRAAALDESLALEKSIPADGVEDPRQVMELGDLSPFTCPECHGALMQMHSGGILRFRCHTGHAYSMNSLLEDLIESTENSLWSALRSIDEVTLLMEHMTKHLSEHGDNESAQNFTQAAKKMRKQGQLIKMATLAMDDSLPHRKPGDL